MKYLSFVYPEALMALINIGPPSVTAMQFIKGLLWESLNPSVMMLTPFCFHIPLIGYSILSTVAMEFYMT